MAGLAFDRHVRAEQRKPCLFVVIEEPRLPVNGVVTKTACIAKPAFVLVVVAMAVDAGRGRVPEHLRCMT